MGSSKEIEAFHSFKKQKIFHFVIIWFELIVQDSCTEVEAVFYIFPIQTKYNSQKKEKTIWIFVFGQPFQVQMNVSIRAISSEVDGVVDSHDLQDKVDAVVVG